MAIIVSELPAGMLLCDVLTLDIPPCDPVLGIVHFDDIEYIQCHAHDPTDPFSLLSVDDQYV